MAKRVLADPLFDPNLICHRSNEPAQDCLSPIRMASAMMPIGDNPVLGFALPAAVSPVCLSRGENRMNWHRLLRRLGLASTNDAIGNRTRHFHGALGKVDVAPLEGKQLTLAQTG